MRLYISAILLAMLFVIAYYIVKTLRRIEESKLGQSVARLLILGFLVIFIEFLNLLLPFKLPSLIAYSLFFIAIDWLLYYLLLFSLEYIGSDLKRHVHPAWPITILTFDSISLILNTFFTHLFDVSLAGGHEKYSIYVIKPNPMFFLHYGVALLLVVSCFLSLIYRIFHSTAFYRNKYLSISIILLIIVILNLVTYNYIIDLSLFGYATMGICIYYCVFVFTPQRLLPKTLLHATHEMHMSLIVFDAEGTVLYKNKLAQRMFESEAQFINVYGVTLENLCRDSFYEKEDSFIKYEILYCENAPRNLKIQMQKLFNEKNEFEGMYYLIKDCTEELAQIDKENFLASHDSLTGLYNKEYFYEKAEQYINFNTHKELLMICTDIREFKMINDFFGTKVGDRVLINFAQMLSSNLSEATLYGRLENDIFGILMLKNKYDETTFAAKAQEALESCFDQSFSFPTINYVGVYEITDRSIPVSVMCDRARMAINSIKGSFQKRVAYYDEQLRDSILQEQELVSDIENALLNGEIKMFLQPQMSATGKMVGAEALVRWEHSTKGMIMPGYFIPIFEKNGLISEIDKYIWELSCKQLKKWKSEGKDSLYISINISPRDFYLMNIYQILTDLVKKYDISPKNLKLEITETAIALDTQRQLELIEKLQAFGFVVEMDDFGSGYSSLNMLKDIKVDVLKIDMAFLRKSKDEERSKKILHMIINLSKQLGMPVISEGVETKEQVDYLSNFGCDLFQGYYFAKPMSVDLFEKTYL